MNNFKKIGMTALAASLVSTSVFAGEMTVAGSASINFENHSKAVLSEPKTFTMGNQLTFSGSGELDNGMTVSLSFILDQGDNTGTANTPFDSHSVTVSSDAMGTLKFSGEGGASATSAMSGTSVGGNMWDNFNSNGGTSVTNSATGNNSFFYTMPALGDSGVGITASYKPQSTSADSSTGFGISYTGVEGLAIDYATTDINSPQTATNGDETAWKLSYAVGSFTLAASNADYDLGLASSDTEVQAYKVSYSVTDDLSVSYKSETVSKGGTTVDGEFTGVSASYTSGGMTVSANMQDGEDIGNATGTTNQADYYGLGLSFAF